jgi:acetamidase/formamidase
MATYELHSSPETCHWGYFDSQLKPSLRIKSGDIATIHCVSGSAEILPGEPFNVLPEHREILGALKPHLGRHILTGPVYVEGAERGDALAVEVLDIKFRTNWGWNAQRPLAGTLPEDFPFYRLTHIPIDSNRGVATMPWGLEIDLKPFFGIMGVAPPPEWGQCSSIEPRAFGGNIDNKHFNIGTTVYLPVFAEGGLFSTGDGHGVQGDGEVNLTALETSLSGTFRFTVRKDMKLNNPRAETATHWITHGFDPDLDDAAKEALRDMIRLITAKTGLSAADAYMLCSLQGDLHVTQTVDGNKGIHCMMAKKVIGG